MKEKNFNYEFSRPIFFLIGILILCALLFIFYYIFLAFSPFGIIEYEGYCIQGTNVARNLRSENFEEIEKTIPLLKVEEKETIYKRTDDFFVGGDEKKNIDINHPIYINDKSAVLNLADGTYLITKNFEEVEGYKNFIMTEGTLFNSYDLSKADTNDYYFIKTNEITFVAVQDFKLRTTTKEYTIPVNSIIYFGNNYITYYEVDNDNLIYKNIFDISTDTVIVLDEETTINYEEFLKKMKLVEEEPEIVEKEEPKKEEEKEEKEEPKKEEEKEEPKKEEKPKEEYIQPTVKAKEFIPSVYSARTTMDIYDPQSRISQAIFIIKRGNKTYQRKLITSGGILDLTGLMPDTEFEIEGTFRYKNEKGEIVEVKFFEGKFKTKSLEELDYIVFHHEPGKIYSNKIELKNFYAEGETSNEILNGISKVEIEIDGIKYKLKNEEIASLINKRDLVYQTAETVSSNKNITYTITAQDRYGNKLKVKNNVGHTRTSKVPPKVKVQLETQDPNLTELSIRLENKDKVELINYRYVILNNGTEVARGYLNENDNLISRTDMDPNGYYTICFYADFDLNDDNGLVPNNLIGEFNFTTIPISSLGKIYWYTNINELEIRDEITQEVRKEKQLTYQGAVISAKLNTMKTDRRLVELIDYVEFSVTDENENVVFSTTLDKNNVKQEDTILIDVSGSGILPDTQYFYSIRTRVKQGSIEENVESVLSNNSFITMKKPAEVIVRNQFVTGELIDFQVKIDDPNDAVLNGFVRMELRDEKENLLYIENIETNTDFKRKKYDRLEANKTYKIYYYAEQYNEGRDNSTYKNNYLILETEFFTEEGISGNLELLSAGKTASGVAGANLINVESNVRWFGHKMFNGFGGYYPRTSADNKTGTLVLASNGSYVTKFLYDLHEYAGKEVTISFTAQASGTIAGNPMYLQYSKTDTSKRIDLGFSNSNKTITFTKTITLDSTGYIGFCSAKKGIGLTITNLQVVAGSKEYSFKPFEYQRQIEVRVNLEDKRKELAERVEDAKYYIAIYKDNETQPIINEEYRNKFEVVENRNAQGSIEGTVWKVLNSVNAFNGIEEEHTYRIELNVMLGDQTYTLDYYELEMKKDDEIKAVTSYEEYLEIQPYGHYILTTDIDFTEEGKSSYTYNVAWQGQMDYNGHTITKDDKKSSGLIGTNGKKGIIENLVLDIKLRNDVERTGYNGVVASNEGLIRNIQINLKESTSVANSNICLTTRFNAASGIIDGFVINFEAPLYGAKELTGGVYYNRGTIRNGYAIGKNIELNYPLAPGQSRNTGVIAFQNYVNAKIENVYSLTSVNAELVEGVTNNIANIVVNNSGNVRLKNVYSVYSEGIGLYEGANIKNGPNVYSAGGIIENNYYFCDEIFENTTNKKTSPLALLDTNYQNQMLNAMGRFNVDKLVNLGYYPHVDMPNVMPEQPYVELPNVEDSDLADIMSTTIINRNEEEDYVDIQCNIHNPSAESIKSINIANLTTEVLEENYNEGVTILILRLSSPKLYVSTYNILSITTQGAFGNTYTRVFETNERNLEIDLYKKITSKEDWKKINKSPTENYKLFEDIDFNDSLEDDILIGNYSGKIDGNGHTISNIRISSSLIASLQANAQVKNLNIYNLNINGNAGKVAFVGTTKSKSKIENVHINVANITNKYTSTSYTATLAGYAETLGTIQDCSVNDSVIKVENSAIAISGGLLGYIASGEISNTYVNDVQITVEKADNSNGIGGFIGQSSSTTIEHCYAIGTVKSNVSYVGGFYGRGSDTVTTNCISKVDVESDLEYLGGIVGKYTTSGNSNKSSGNLILGSVYSKLDSQFIGRVYGIQEGTFGTDNYAYAEQKINGSSSTENLDALRLISLAELKNEISGTNTYTEILGWESDSYDFSKVSEGILPKLYYLGTTEELPNQKDVYFENQGEITVKDLEIQQEQSLVNAALTLKPALDIEDIQITIENMGISNISCDKDEGNNITKINFTATPNKYYDSYKLEKVTFKLDGVDTTIDVNKKIDTIFYKTISNLKDDWNYLENAVGTYQNYRISKDLDFAEKETPLKLSLTAGRIESDTTGVKRTLKNINITVSKSDTALFENITNSVKDLHFENVTFTRSGTTQYDRIGIVLMSTSDYENISFNNIKFFATEEQSNKNSTVGIVARLYGGKLNNIQLTGITIRGNTNLGSLVGQVVNAEIYNTTLTGATITGSGNSIGGVIGTQDSYTSTTPCKTREVNVSDVEITGQSQVGGIFGYGMGVYKSSVRESIITGTSNVGGIGGKSPTTYESSYTHRELTSENNIITGSGSYIGGIIGYTSRISGTGKVVVKDCTITGTSTSSNYVAGVIGYMAYSSDTPYGADCAVLNTKIETDGTHAAGCFGFIGGNLYRCYVQDTTIKGHSKVGGLAGQFDISSVYTSYVDADITAIHTVGGIIGYLNNIGMTNANNISKIYQTFVVNSNIEATGGGNVGGLVGESYQEIISPENGDYYYRNFLEVYMKSEDASTTSLGFGNRKSEIGNLETFYVYKDSTINGSIVSNIDSGLESSKFVNLDTLKNQNFYKNTLAWSTNFAYTTLSQNRYPTINNSNVLGQTGIPLPTGTLTSSLDSQEEVIESEEKQEEVRKIPTMVAYAIDVNKFNVDFSEVYDGLKLTYKSENTEEATIDLEERTCTFEYNYQVPVTLTVSNGELTETVTINPEDISGTTSIVDGKVVYLNGNELSINNNKIDGTFVNIYDDLALMQNGNIYNIKEDSTLENEQAELKLVETIAKELYDYNGNMIEAFGTYSVVNGIESDLIYTVKNQSLSITDGLVEDISSDKIVDNYNGNEYETVLGTDGMLHDLKTKINYPKDFVNENITSMSVDVESKQAVITYENGDVLGFNYMTGKETYENISEVESTEDTEEPISFMAYLMNQITGTDEKEGADSKDNSDVKNTETSKEYENTDSKDALTTTYEETKELEEKLEEKPIESDTGTNADYVTVYDSKTDSYEIYKEDSLLNIKEDEEKVESETQKIAASQDLKEYYMTAKGESLENDKGAYFVIGSIAGVFISLMILRDYIIKRRRKNILAKKKERDRKKNQK